MNQSDTMERSCGAVLYRMEEGEPRYVLVQGGGWGFPKGHMEAGETELETALREVKEETGVEAQVDPSFRETEEYLLPESGVRKQVVYFLAFCPPEQEPRAQNEIRRLTCVPYESAVRRLRFPGQRAVLALAHRRLTGC